MPAAVVIGLVGLAVALGVGGGLLIGTRARASGGFTLVAAALTLASAVRPGHTATAAVLLTAAAGLGAGPALLVYPRLGWRHPVDFSALVAMLALGGIATAFADRPTVADALGLVAAVVYMGHGMWRFERADEPDRQAALWTLLAVGVAVLVAGQGMFLLSGFASLTLGLLCCAAVPLVMALGVRRPDAVDVRGLITQVVVFAVAVISFVSVVLGVTAALDLAGLHDPAVGLIALLGAVTAVFFHPLQVALRGVIDELLFGDRPDPLHAATQVADRIGDDPVLALRALREALVLPYASLWAAGTELASSGTPVTHSRRLPLALDGDTVGEMVVGLRAGDLRLSSDDEHVLRIVAPLLAQTLRARALAEDLQASRGQAIEAIAEERRRLRRDLHDGLGPTLSGIAFTADAARNSLRDPGTADDLLRGLRADAVSAIGEIRRLVYDMRPPALDELGLVPALRQRAGMLRTADGSPLQVVVDAPPDLPALSAAVEVAAYRIVLEALTNAARHSGSRHAEVSIAATGDALALAVRDDGPATAPWTPGVGLISMGERASEVGGTLSAVPTAAGGRVEARLPLGFSDLRAERSDTQ